MAFRFRLLAGQHIGPDPKFPNDPTKEVKYSVGDVIETHQDLTKHNKPGAVKFERLHADDPTSFHDQNTPVARAARQGFEGEPPAFASPVGLVTPAPTKKVSVDDGLESMTVKDLLAYAEGEEIDIHGATRKDEILRLIRAACTPTGAK